MMRVSIRTRLLLVYISIILIGFLVLTLTAGEQVASGARVDYGQRLQNEIILIAQGIDSSVRQFNRGSISEDDLSVVFQRYEERVNGDLILYAPPGGRMGMGRANWFDKPELEAALRGQVVLVERRAEDGSDRFFTAAPVLDNRDLLGLIQLSVPASNLRDAVTQRWLALGLIGLLVMGAAALAALWLAQSIIRPLGQLRESAVRLSQGDFTHRTPTPGSDEIGDVARAFNEMAGQVESMLEEQRAFASNTSHELRTPLTTIRLRTEALRYDQLDEAEARQYIAEIDQEVARLGNLVQDLTLLSRFDAGRAELGQDQVDMGRFASGLQQQMTPAAQEKRILITLALPENPPVVRASLNHLLVVFRNVLDNAIKYSGEGSAITWTVQTAAGGSRHIIQDSGRGVDPAHLPHLFERFYRADKARSRDIPGTGLGLALAKSIVEAYGGSISLTSAGLGQGTTVTLFWPSEPAAAPGG